MQNQIYSLSKISLCLTYPRLSDPDKNTKFRVADLVDGELIPVNFFSGDIETKMIYSRPHEAINYRAELVEWWYEEEEYNKTKSSVYHGNEVYEVFNCVDYISKYSNSVDTLLLDIKKGLPVPEGLTDRFFLTFGEDDLHFRSILVESKNITNGKYRISISGENVSEVNPTLDIFLIKKKDIIDTSLSNIRLGNDEYVKRYFYKKCILPSEEKKVPVFGVVDYLPYLIKRYVKNNKTRFNLTNNNIKDISYFINEFIKDAEEINSFSKNILSSEDDTRNELIKVKESIANFLIGEDSLDCIIDNILLNHDEFNKLLIQKVKDEWMKSSDNEKQVIEELLERMKKEESELSSQVLLERKKRVELDKRISQSISELKELEKQQNNIKIEIQNNIDSYKKDILRVLGEHELFRYFNQDKHKSESTVPYSITSPDKISDNPVTLDDMRFIINDLSENLKIIGTDGKYTDEISKYIMALMVLSVPVVVPHHIAIYIANACSAIIENSEAVEIRLSAGVSSLDIRKIFSEISQRVVFVSNFIEDIDDDILSQITREQNKFIIIPFKDELSVKLLSRFVFDAFTVLNYDEFITVPTSEPLITSITERNVFDNISRNSLRIDKIFDTLRSTFKNKNFSNSYMLKHAKIIDIFQEFNGSKKESVIVYNEINFIDSAEVSKQINECDKDSSMQVGEFL